MVGEPNDEAVAGCAHTYLEPCKFYSTFQRQEQLA